MINYFIIGCIVSAVETLLAYRDLKKYGLTMQDIHPTFGQLNDVGLALVNVFTFIGIAIIWPVQVGFWVNRLVSCENV